MLIMTMLQQHFFSHIYIFYVHYCLLGITKIYALIQQVLQLQIL